MSQRLSPLWELTVCRTKEFIREPEAIFWVFLFPLVLAVALGFAFREKPPDRTPIGIVAGPQAEQAAAALGRSPVLQPRVMEEKSGREALRTGRISLLVEPGPPAVFHFDETRPDSRIARLAADDALQRAAGRRDAFAVREEKVKEPGARYIDFLIPGLLGMNLMSTGVWSIAFSVTMARSRKLLKRFLATPMRKSHYLLAQMLSRLTFLILEIGFLVGFGWIAFGVAVRGSLLLLLVVCLLSALSFCGMGLLIASRVKTIEGASGLANLLMMPMWLLSGVFFSSERFPDAVQPFIRALPLTAVNDALRGVINEARTLPDIAPQIGIVLAWGLISFAVALKIFRWK
jgi:ABC-type multidrug transport system permease subunit